MNGVATIDVRHLPNLVSGSRGTLWWSMVLLLVIESTVFGTLIAGYFYLRMGHLEWPPGGIEPPDLLLPTLNTVLLVASSLPMYLGDSAIREGNTRRLITGLSVAGVMGAVFLVLKVIEYSKVEYLWDDHAYGSIIWLIIGFHSAHVGSVVLKTVVVVVLAVRGYFNAERHLGVQINGLYWHFVVAVWVPLYFVIYWAPRVLGTE
jgi:cytochrome c oxidase subunit III